MRKMILFGAALCCMLMFQSGHADEAAVDAVATKANEHVHSNNGAYSDGGHDECRDQPTGDCWCKMCHWEPCYYNTWKCIDVPQTRKKQCWRCVPKYYEVERCRMVPEYYTETCCKNCYEPYCVEECVTCKKWICEKQCRYVPRYYYKRVCNPAPACQPDCQ